MAKQARAVQTRRSIVEAAASVFDDYGYERAAISEILRRANVTKGALYFHFQSKEAIAQAIMDEQTATVDFTSHERAGGSPLQALVDGGQQFAYALRHDPMARAGTRLSIEGVFFGGPHPWGDWFDTTAHLLKEGKARGEVLPHVDPETTAELIVSSFTGIQLISESVTKRADLRERVAQLWRHLLPGIANPAVISWIKTEGTLQLEELAALEEKERGAAPDERGAGGDIDAAAGSPEAGDLDRIDRVG
ncbi:ScbR family autoregulator-binding transcription factor [Streptomyces physcomitrii]|uniref:TetR/AcrR family transcriptional regulator n=1 Tax=Streptomyces physcomitrii TaxID=2724184 RepID=A0ABX1H7N1_9ACTN|nr:ScbR family autoregulator-binding transcription factor [Streptomyces physcomitrii]NKI44376.1 TetR/AcrR family transcriptional regulator [Streptomyces physcomitrii]